MQQVRLSFPSDKRYLSLVASAVQELCGLISALPASSAYNIQLAVDEAIVNIIEHAYDEDPAGIVELTAEIHPDHLTLRLCDWGASFDSAQVPEPDLSAPHEHGYGVYLIRELMDQVTYEHDPSGSNCVTLIKRLG
ncbi:MAG: ATP-binding protein [Anaerolineae bacterium]|nr:ATP-binding protein [Anaerolineae bacterium]